MPKPHTLEHRYHEGHCFKCRADVSLTDYTHEYAGRTAITRGHCPNCGTPVTILGHGSPLTRKGALVPLERDRPDLDVGYIPIRTGPCPRCGGSYFSAWGGEVLCLSCSRSPEQAEAEVTGGNR